MKYTRKEIDKIGKVLLTAAESERYKGSGGYVPIHGHSPLSRILPFLILILRMV